MSNTDKSLTFAQRVGAKPMPSQLLPDEMSDQLRAALWGVIQPYTRSAAGHTAVPASFQSVLRDAWIGHEHKMAHLFNPRSHETQLRLGALFAKGDYADVFGFVEFILRHPNCPSYLRTQVAEALAHCHAAYRLIDGDTFVPIASEQDAATFTTALQELDKANLVGARAHLKRAGEELGHGHFDKSIRESISAVESVARMIEPSATTLDPALKKIKDKVGLHPALQKGISQIYGYTSDESGIRHALLDEPQANVDVYDALFMLGACSAFLTYFIGKCRNSGLLKQ
jgi:hypothetical protein